MKHVKKYCKFAQALEFLKCNKKFLCSETPDSVSKVLSERILRLSEHLLRGLGSPHAKPKSAIPIIGPYKEVQECDHFFRGPKKKRISLDA